MLARILNLVQADKFPLDARPAGQSAFLLLHLALASPLLHRKGKLGVHELETELAALVTLLKSVHGAELKVHGVGVRELLEESEELYDVVLLHDLQADNVGRPLFVDGYYHAAARYGE